MFIVPVVEPKPPVSTGETFTLVELFLPVKVTSLSFSKPTTTVSFTASKSFDSVLRASPFPLPFTPPLSFT